MASIYQKNPHLIPGADPEEYDDDKVKYRFMLRKSCTKVEDGGDASEWKVSILGCQMEVDNIVVGIVKSRKMEKLPKTGGEWYMQFEDTGNNPHLQICIK